MSPGSTLHLRDHLVVDEGFAALWAATLGGMRHLETLTLDLSRNAIGDDALLGLSGVRVCSSELRHLTLNLADNDLSNQGMLALAPALSHENTPNLRSVVLDVTNNLIEHPEGPARVMMALRHVKRMELNASSNRLGTFAWDEWEPTAWETLALDLTSNGLVGTTECGCVARCLSATCAPRVRELVLSLGYNHLGSTDPLLGRFPELHRMVLDLVGGEVRAPPPLPSMCELGRAAISQLVNSMAAGCQNLEELHLTAASCPTRPRTRR